MCVVVVSSAEVYPRENPKSIVAWSSSLWCTLHQCSRLHSDMVEKDILPHSQSCASPEDHGLFYHLAASHIWNFNAGNLTFWYVTEMREQSSNIILAAGDQNTLLLI
jgi:hypothetical protein